MGRRATVFVSLTLFACGDPVVSTAPPQPSAASQIAQREGISTVTKTPPAPARLERVRAWPKLEAWMQHQPIDRAPTMSAATDERARLQLGKQVYGAYCVNCHGDTGQGDGPRGPLFDPPPRNFARGKFKFRSTASGAAPTEEDLFKVITGGLRGTGMPTFADLPESQRWAVVRYVTELAGVGDDPVDPVAVPAAPADLGAATRIAAGKIQWSKSGCDSCHGDTGRGDGPSAPSVTKQQERDLVIPDFAVQPFKRGDDPADLYRTIVTGLDGTAMPAFSADSTALWDLVAYVRTLRTEVVEPGYRRAAEAFIRTQYAQAKHAAAGGCGCKAGKLKTEFQAARAELLSARASRE